MIYRALEKTSLVEHIVKMFTLEQSVQYGFDVIIICTENERQWFDHVYFCSSIDLIIDEPAVQATADILRYFILRKDHSDQVVCFQGAIGTCSSRDDRSIIKIGELLIGCIVFCCVPKDRK